MSSNNPIKEVTAISSRPLSPLSVLLVTILVGSFILAYFPVWKNLVLHWYGSEEYSHGFFILPLCLYIVWRKREVLSVLPLQPSLWGLALTAFFLSVYLFGSFAEISTVQSFSMVLSIVGVIIYLFGFQMAKALVFPLFLLLFMIPVPAQRYSELTIPLQLFVSKASVGISSLLGLPIYLEGNVIHLPGRTLQVVQACSGLRSMISLLTLSGIFGYFTMSSNLLRVCLFFTGIPAAIIVNIVRVTVMIAAFYYFQTDLTVGTIHTVFGILMFFLALAIIVATKGVLALWDRSTKEISSS